MKAASVRRFRIAARAPARGSALITVLIVLLVLSVLGLSISYFTTIENRISGNAKLEKTAFYAAESGLREGEAAIATAIGASMAPSSFLTQATSTYGYLPPGGGNLAAPLKTATGTTPYTEVAVTMPSVAANNQVYFTLYVRNNAEDPGGPLTDTDSKINLIAVGRVGLAGGVGIVKVLEEQINLNPQGSGVGTQKGGNTGGTGGGTKT